jgi:hypothetical protein
MAMDYSPCWDLDYDIELESDLYIYQSGSQFDYSSATDDSDALAQVGDVAIPDQKYTAEGVTSFCVGGFYNGLSMDEGANCEVLGDLGAEVDTGAGQPNIDSTNPSYGTVGDNNVSMSIYGENLLNSNGSPPNISYSGDSNAGITFSNIQANGTGEVDLTYSIASSASSSLIDILLYTDGGTAMGPDFNIGYPDASISGISPSAWQAGQTTPISITGSNFGSNPSVTLDVSDITISNIAVQNDGSINASVDVPANESATTVNITVEPGYGSGCHAGNCLMSDPSDGTGQTTAQASIRTSTPAYFFSSRATPVQGGCASSYIGSFFDVNYYVVDQKSNRISVAGMTPLELAPGMLQYGEFAAPPQTDSTGSFNDNPVGSCFAVPLNTQACLSSFAVLYEINTSTANNLSIATATFRRDCALGQRLEIQGNPTGNNPIYTQGAFN